MQMKMKGIHCQESQIIMTKRAAQGSADQTHVSTDGSAKERLERALGDVGNHLHGVAHAQAA